MQSTDDSEPSRCACRAERSPQSGCLPQSPAAARLALTWHARRSAAEAGASCEPAATALAAAAAAAQAAAVEEARRELARRLTLCTALPPHPSLLSAQKPTHSPGAGCRPGDSGEDSSAGFSTEGLEGLSDGGSVLPRSALSPRAARHPAARRRAEADAERGAAATTASKQRQLLQLQRRRKRELEKLLTHGTPAEADAARLELPAVQAALSRRARRRVARRIAPAHIPGCFQTKECAVDILTSGALLRNGTGCTTTCSAAKRRPP